VIAKIETAQIFADELLIFGNAQVEEIDLVPPRKNSKCKWGPVAWPVWPMT
jgi:hypothetical protein